MKTAPTSSRMSICLVEGYWTPGQWSMSLYAQELRRLLTDQKSSLEIRSVIPQKPGFLRLVPHGFAKHRLAKHWARWIQLPKQLDMCRADVYHCIEPGDIVALRRIDPQRIVASCHDLIPWRLHSKNARLWPISWASDQLYKRMWRGLTQAARIVVPSECTKRDILEFTGISPDKVRVIPYWINPVFRPLSPEERSSTRETLRRKWGVSRGPLLLHVGSTIFYKNVETLLAAFSRMGTDGFHSPPQLVRVGSALTAKQMNLARRSGVAERVIELGERTPEELAEVYQMVDAMVFPSWYEGFGRPVSEAMACGTPVIVGKGGALPEVVGEAGLVVDPGDAGELASVMRRVLEDETLRITLREKVLSRVQRYQNQNFSAAFYAVYKEVQSFAEGRAVS